MPVHRRSVLRPSYVIVNGDLDCVSPVGFDHRSRKLAIYEYAVLDCSEMSV